VQAFVRPEEKQPEANAIVDDGKITKEPETESGGDQLIQSQPRGPRKEVDQYGAQRNIEVIEGAGFPWVEFHHGAATALQGGYLGIERRH
jgi:hypothetical protein